MVVSLLKIITTGDGSGVPAASSLEGCPHQIQREVFQLQAGPPIPKDPVGLKTGLKPTTLGATLGRQMSHPLQVTPDARASCWSRESHGSREALCKDHRFGGAVNERSTLNLPKNRCYFIVHTCIRMLRASSEDAFDDQRTNSSTNIIKSDTKSLKGQCSSCRIMCV